MNDRQVNQLLNVLTAQLAMLQGIHGALQAMNIKNGAQAGTFNFKDVQKILDSTAASIKHP